MANLGTGNCGAIEPADRLACVEISTYPLAATVRPRQLRSTLSMPAFKHNLKRLGINDLLSKTMLAILSEARGCLLCAIDPVSVKANVGENRRRA